MAEENSSDTTRPRQGPPGDAVEPDPAESHSETATQIRGSTLLLGGRFLAMGINLVTQVLIVRLLTRAEFGAFAYGLSIVATAKILVALGHTRTITRFLALYEEARDYPRLLGTLVMEAIIPMGTGLALFLGVWGLQGWIAGSLVDDPLAAAVLVIMILLAPIEALDALLEGTCAVFTSPRAIFFRKHLLGPLLRLTVAGVLWLTGAGVFLLATGYVAAALVGVSLYAVTVVRLLRRQGLLDSFSLGRLSMPFREVSRFSVPLLTTEFVYISMSTISIVLLGMFSGTTAVAAFRAILPAAKLNQFVMRSFTLLFMPLASRLYARGDLQGMRVAYWRTAVWLTVFSFPLYALTGPLAESTTVLLFGERYAGSAVYLALLSTGLYFNICLGFNALVLQVYGRLRYLVTVNVAVGLLNVALALVLVPRHGALGVALANAATLVIQNVANQAGLARLGVGVIDRRFVRVYAVVAGAAGLLWAAQHLLAPPLLAGWALAALVSLGVLAANRDLLAVEETFPELLRLPLVGRLLRR